MRKYILVIFSLIMCSIVLISCSNNQNSLDQQNNKEEQQNDNNNDSSQNGEEEKVPEKEKIVSITKDLVKEQEDISSIEFPKDDTPFTIEPNDEDVQQIINPFTGRAYKNVYYVKGNFGLENEEYNFDIILSSEDTSFSDSEILKYTSDKGTEYTFEKAQLYLVEEEEFEDL